MRWMRAILLGALALVVAQQIYAHVMTAIYGERCTDPIRPWWGEYKICWAKRP